MVRYQPTKLVQFPKEIVSVILDFEGGLNRAWKLDYIQSIYIAAYKNYFGPHTTFRKMCRPHNYLPLFVHFAKWMHRDHLWVRYRASRKHMKPWRREFGAYCKNLEKNAIVASPYCSNVLKLLATRPMSLRVSLAAAPTPLLAPIFP